MTALRAAIRSLIPTALVSVLALPFAAGCGGSDPPEAVPDETPTRPEGVALCYTELAETHAATKAFRAALAEGDRGSRAAAVDQLDAAVTEHPEEAELALLLGLAQLWRVAEPLESDQAVFVQSALAAREHLARAYELCPTDHRIPAWLGPVLVNMGRALQNQDIIDEGLAVLQKGIDHYPSFVLFSKVLVYADEPADSPDFQNAVDAVYANVDDCSAEDGGLTNDPACNNGAAVPHNLEGSAVFLGDVFAKSGRKSDAMSFYKSAEQSEDYASWDWHDLLADRMETLDARVAAYGTSSAADDPDAAWTSGYQCAICHTR